VKAEIKARQEQGRKIEIEANWHHSMFRCQAHLMAAMPHSRTPWVGNSQKYANRWRQSDHHHQHTNTRLLIGWIAFLLLKKHHQGIRGNL